MTHDPFDETPQESIERRKAFVLAQLGYDPQGNSRGHRPTAEQIADARAAVESYDKAVAEGKPLPLKSPDRPASPQLKALLARQNAGEPYCY